MRQRRALNVLAAAAVLLVTGCGTTEHNTRTRVQRTAVRAAARGPAVGPPPPLQALVTAQTEGRLLVADLPRGRVIREVTVAGDPSYVDATDRVVVVVSSGSGTVTLLDRRSLRVIRVFHGFDSPHIPAISPDGRYAYVTDDGSGELTVIGLYNEGLIGSVPVGPEAHHLAFSPDRRQVWVALGQAAQTLTLLSTVTAGGKVDLGHPHVVGHLHPGFLAHDLLFTPGGKQVWVTSADGSAVSVFSAETRRLLFRVPAAAPPQHLAFADGYAYITSGYGSSVEQVNLHSGEVVRRARAPYGSFDLDAGGGYVVTSSLLQGTLAIYNERLQLLRVRLLAPSTEDVALSVP